MGTMKSGSRSLSSSDFPLQVNGATIVRKDGTFVATAVDAEVAKEIANRLNLDQSKRHEENWSA